MGDLLQTTPLLHRIKQRYPEAVLSVLVDRRNIELAQGIPLVDEVISLDLNEISKRINQPRRTLFRKYMDLKRALGDLPSRNFDLVYNINFSKISSLLAQFFGNAQVIGYELDPKDDRMKKEPWVRFVFHLMRNRNLLRLNLVDLLAHYEKKVAPIPSRLLYEAGSQDLSGPQLDLPPSGELFIGFQLGCGGDLRRWPIESFAALGIRLAREMGAKVVLLGSPDEVELGRAFSQCWEAQSRLGSDSKALHNFIGKTTIPELAALLKRIRILVTADTGTMHLATALGTRVLALFMATASCHETGPYGEGHVVIETHVPCHPCHEGERPCPDPFCRNMIPPGVVYEVLRQILTDPLDLGGNRNLIPGPDFSHWDSRVQVYRSFMDEWGVKFLPLVLREPTAMEIMGAGYRELGRKLMAEDYGPSPGRLAFEFSQYYKKVTTEVLLEIQKIVRELEGYSSAKERATFPPLQDSPLLRPLLHFLREETLLSFGGERIGADPPNVPFGPAEWVIQEAQALLKGLIGHFSGKAPSDCPLRPSLPA